MTEKYLIFPLEQLDDLKTTTVLILSQLAYMKKALNELYPSSAYLGKTLNLSLSTIHRGIDELIQNNYITIHIKNNNKRYIYLTNKSLSIYGLLHTLKPKKTNDKPKNDVLQEFLSS